MTVVVRDKPFPVVDPSLSPNRDSSLWYQLPLFVNPRQAIVASDLGRSGLERYNAFFVAPQLTQEVLGAGGIDLLQPLWSKDDILRHGLRRVDVLSRYTSAKADLLTLSETQRLKIRDWYAINPCFLNGTLQLGVGMPDIRVGARVRVPGDAGDSGDETYYVETVSHTWRFGPGLRTALGVTRGWRGTDTEYLQALDDLVAHYHPPTRAAPSEALA